MQEAVDILRRTPGVLDQLLRDLPEAWVRADEGHDTFSPFDVVGHLVHGERTDWMPRLEMILTHGETRTFEPFDRFAHFEASRGRNLADLLDVFADLRAANLARLQQLQLGTGDLSRRGRHPEFGPVTLAQLLATWVVHDLSHIGQIVRVMARGYTGAVGPWRAYLPMLGHGPTAV